MTFSPNLRGEEAGVGSLEKIPRVFPLSLSTPKGSLAKPKTSSRLFKPQNILKSVSHTTYASTATKLARLASWLTAHTAALPEVQSQGPSAHFRQPTNTCNSSFRRSDTPSSGYHRHCTHRDKPTHGCINNAPGRVLEAPLALHLPPQRHPETLQNSLETWQYPVVYYQKQALPMPHSSR